MRRFVVAVLLAWFQTACIVSTDTIAGPQGDAGLPGTPGVEGGPGDPGVACWDLNANGTKDPSEDVNGDGSWDAHDCTGSQGLQGASPFETNPDGSIYYNGGNVGIGTKDAWANLTVYNPTSSAGDQRIASFRRSRTGVGTDGLDIYDDGAGDGTTTTSTVKLKATGADSCNLGIGPTGTELLISATGNVGIGTTTPEAPLHVVGLDQSPALTIERSGQISPGKWSLNTNAGGLHFHEDTGLVATGGQARVTFGNGGNVGIGTTTPSADLFPFSPLLDIAGARGTLTLRTTDPNGIATLRLTGPTGSSLDDWHINMTAGNDSSLHVSPKAGAIEALVVTNKGDVGIGTSIPKATLDVNGTARLKSYSGAPPFPCDAVHAGTIALTGIYKMCICNGNSWNPSDGSPLCNW